MRDTPIEHDVHGQTVEAGHRDSRDRPDNCGREHDLTRAHDQRAKIVAAAHEVGAGEMRVGILLDEMTGGAGRASVRVRLQGPT